MNSLESERKRARIEYEKDSGNEKLGLRRLEEKYDDLQQNFQYIAEQEKNAKDQLKEIKKEYETYRNKSEQKVQNLQREKLKVCAERDELQEDTSKQQMELKNALFRQGTEKAVIQNKLEDTESQLENVKRRLSEVMIQLPELEQLRERSRTAEHRVKELEQKLSRQDEATGVAMVMQTQLAKETNESNLLLKEKADSLQGKLQRAEQRITELTRVEIENEVHRQPSLHKMLANLQKSQVVLLETQSELKSSAHIHETAYQRAAQELTAVKKDLVEMKVDDISDEVDDISDEVDDISDEVDDISDEVDDISDEVDDISDEVDDISDEVDGISDEADDI
ncbi:Mitotic spindle assembly checkpoint protein MAD1 [Desmophyllum pertusum]|uniref:Mitotic spindle assembly checkpoint protein MAD1 n=1 Tax=Desmophyllum pertusum TaxID=174260 RepID=A0A9W9YX91_9CNID|nr:Mitotic spindle assembly checkpoint protein MAD1 [Desmophyllum pertusum]